MKKTMAAFCLAVCALAVVVSSCKGHSVQRVDAGTQMDLSGYWNDTDVRLASDALIKKALDSSRLGRFNAERGRPPVIIVGYFKNASDEHIDTTILSQRLELSILNSGRADFVASGELRDALRAERMDQQRGYTDDRTVAALGRERGADFMMTGSVRTMVDRYGNTATRSYFIVGELTDIATNQRIWMDTYDEIKKVIRSSSVRP